jgi:hypothetical protein
VSIFLHWRLGQSFEIKPGGIAACAVAYELSDLTTPVTLKATQGYSEELGTQDFLLDKLLQSNSSSGPTFKTEDYARISFNIDSSWDNELANDGRMLYYPDVEEFTGFIQCSFLETEIEIGSVSEQIAKTLLDGGMDGMMNDLNNPVEMSRKHFKIGNRYAVRASFYSDVTDNDINDDTQMVLDAVVVLFDDGMALLVAIFTPTEYEETYKDVIETTLSSVKVNISLTPSSSTPASASSADWRQLLKDYEKFMDAYIDVLKKYKENPADLSILSDYMNMMAELEEWTDKYDDMSDEFDDPAELAEFMKEWTRIYTKQINAIAGL